MYVDSDQQFVVDCEYSNETSELISIAVVPLWPHSGRLVGIEVCPDREFYEVVSPLPSKLSPWVQEHVTPKLEKPGISLVDLQRKFEAFLFEHQIQELHYDWVEDIVYVNRLMVTGPGERLQIPCKFLSHIHHPNLNSCSQSAHNALDDARAIAAALRIRLAGLC